MIYHYEDFLDDLEEQFPLLTRASLEKIVKNGLYGINRVMRRGGELIMLGKGLETYNWFKFFPYMDTETQERHATRNYYRKLKLKENAGK